MEITLAEISEQIYSVRGTRVMLDSDLANHYQTETRTLNQTVRRHAKKFPEDFMFQVTKKEFESLKPQIVSSNTRSRGGRQKLPLVFTEQGVGMLSFVMDNNRSTAFSILAVRAFAQVRQTPDSQNLLTKRVEHLEASFQELKHMFFRLENKIDTFIGLSINPQQSLPSLAVATDNTRRPSMFASKTHVEETEEILSTVAQYFGLKVKDLKTTNRTRSVAVPRHIAIYLIRKRLGTGYKEIGNCFGGKDHTTILHAYQKINDALCKGGRVGEAVVVIENSLQTKLRAKYEQVIS